MNSHLRQADCVLMMEHHRADNTIKLCLQWTGHGGRPADAPDPHEIWRAGHVERHGRYLVRTFKRIAADALRESGYRAPWDNEL